MSEHLRCFLSGGPSLRATALTEDATRSSSTLWRSRRRFVVLTGRLGFWRGMAFIIGFEDESSSSGLWTGVTRLVACATLPAACFRVRPFASSSCLAIYSVLFSALSSWIPWFGCSAILGFDGFRGIVHGTQPVILRNQYSGLFAKNSAESEIPQNCSNRSVLST